MDSLISMTRNGNSKDLSLTLHLAVPSYFTPSLHSPPVITAVLMNHTTHFALTITMICVSKALSQHWQTLLLPLIMYYQYPPLYSGCTR